VPGAEAPGRAARTAPPAAGAHHGATSDALVSLLDIAPTCWHAAGVEPPAPLDGQPLEAQIAASGRPFVVAEGEGFLAISDGHTKYVTATRGATRYRELLDLDADPLEYRNVVARPEYAPRHLALAASLERLLVDALLP
jgi:arylsulfatase A-like enzyme